MSLICFRHKPKHITRGEAAQEEEDQACTHFLHGHSRKTVDPRTPTMPGRGKRTRGRGSVCDLSSVRIKRRTIPTQTQRAFFCFHHPQVLPEYAGANTVIAPAPRPPPLMPNALPSCKPGTEVTPLSRTAKRGPTLIRSSLSANMRVPFKRG